MTSKFTGLFDDAVTENKPAPTRKIQKVEKPKTINQPANTVRPYAKPNTESSTKPKVGKSSNPEYCKVAAYIRKDTYEQVQIELLKERQNRDFSELLQELLSEWLQTHKSKR